MNDNFHNSNSTTTMEEVMASMDLTHMSSNRRQRCLPRAPEVYDSVNLHNLGKNDDDDDDDDEVVKFTESAGSTRRNSHSGRYKVGLLVLGLVVTLLIVGLTFLVIDEPRARGDDDGNVNNSAITPLQQEDPSLSHVPYSHLNVFFNLTLDSLRCDETHVYTVDPPTQSVQELTSRIFKRPLIGAAMGTTEMGCNVVGHVPVGPHGAGDFHVTMGRHQGEQPETWDEYHVQHTIHALHFFRDDSVRLSSQTGALDGTRFVVNDRNGTTGIVRYFLNVQHDFGSYSLDHCQYISLYNDNINDDENQQHHHTKQNVMPGIFVLWTLDNNIPGPSPQPLAPRPTPNLTIVGVLFLVGGVTTLLLLFLWLVLQAQRNKSRSWEQRPRTFVFV